MIITDLSALAAQKKSLKKRLALLQKQKKTTIKKSKKKFISKPFKNKIKNKKYEKINSKIDIDLINSEMENKFNKNFLKKKEIELLNCTFQPKINLRSEKMIQNRISIYKRDLPIKNKEYSEESDYSDSDEYIESKEFDINDGFKKKKKFNKNFYEKQLEWKNKKMKKIEDMKLKKNIQIVNSVRNIPKTNKRKNKFMVKKKGNFIDRFQNDMQKSQKLLRNLDKKYNHFDFKPKINHNINIGSVVMEKLKGEFVEIDEDIDIKYNF